MGDESECCLFLQWRETRELPKTIKELKAQLPAAVDGERPPSPLDGEIKALEAVRILWFIGSVGDVYTPDASELGYT